MKKYATGKRGSFANVVGPGQEQLVSEYLAHLCKDYSDAMTVIDIAEITGLNKKSLLRLLKAGHIKSIANSPLYVIPKSYLLEFATTKRFREIRTSSERFNNLIKGYVKLQKQE